MYIYIYTHTRIQQIKLSFTTTSTANAPFVTLVLIQNPQGLYIILEVPNPTRILNTSSRDFNKLNYSERVFFCMLIFSTGQVCMFLVFPDCVACLLIAIYKIILSNVIFQAITVEKFSSPQMHMSVLLLFIGTSLYWKQVLVATVVEKLLLLFNPKHCF